MVLIRTLEFIERYLQQPCYAVDTKVPMGHVPFENQVSPPDLWRHINDEKQIFDSWWWLCQTEISTFIELPEILVCHSKSRL